MSPSKNERAAAARAEAQAQVRAKERRTTVTIVGVSILVLALFAAIVFFIVNTNSVPPLEEADAPAPADANGGIPVGTTGIAGVDVPTDAVRVDVYEDFMCPVCAQFEQIAGPDLDELREDGTIALYYHPISILDRFSEGTKFSTRSANAAATVADAAPEAFLDFTKSMYANQPAEGTTGLDDGTIEAIAVASGVPTDVASTLDDGLFTKWVVAATERGSIDGVGGTPTVAVNGEILPQTEVPYFQAGALKAYLLSVAEGTA